jgi:hypothetical protein
MPFPRALDFYVGTSSVVQGHPVPVFIHAVSNNSHGPLVRLEVSRIGKSPESDVVLATLIRRVGAQSTNPSPYRNGAGWLPTVILHTQSSDGVLWVPGLYRATLSKVPDDDKVRRITYFVVLPQVKGRISRILYQWPFATYHAYNAWGNRSLYADQDLSPNQQQLSCEVASVGNRYSSPRVSFMRPFLDIEDLITRELPLLRWLYSEGITVEHCSSMDLHSDPHLLDRYRLLIVAGHHEYWSTSMRKHVEEFVGAGGNLAIFAGNTCWWQVRFEAANGDIRMICYREVNNPGARVYPNEDCKFDPIYNNGTNQNNLATIEWWRVPDSGSGFALTRQSDISQGKGNFPENLMTNVSTRFGFHGNGIVGPNQPSFKLQSGAHQHWAFANTALNEGDSFGVLGRVINFDGEVDGGSPDLGGTPGNFKKLAACERPTDVTEDGTPYWVAEFPSQHTVLSECTMGLRVNSGTVFTAATNRWTNGFFPGTSSKPLEGQSDQVVQQITKNVIRRLSQRRTVTQLEEAGANLIITFSDGGAMTTTSAADLVGGSSVVSYDGADPIVKVLYSAGKVFAAFASGLITSSSDTTNLAVNTVYKGSQRVVAWAPWASGVVAVFDGSGVYYSPDGQNLGSGNGATRKIQSGAPAIKGLWAAGNAIFSSYSDHSCYRTTDPADLRMTQVYAGGESVSSILALPNAGANAVCAAFSGGGIYVSGDGLNLRASRIALPSSAAVVSVGAFLGGVMIGLKDGSIYFSPDGTTFSLRYKGAQHAILFRAIGQGILTVFESGGVYWSPDGETLGGGASNVRVYLAR